MKKKIADFILYLIVALGILIVTIAVILAFLQAIVSIAIGNFLLVGIPSLIVAIFGIYVLFKITEELK